MDITKFDYRDALTDSKAFSEAFKISEFLSDSQFIPMKFKGKPQDILVASHLGAKLGLSPFEVMNGTTFIQGKPSFSSPMLIALCNARGPFKGPIRWESSGEGKSLVVTAVADLKDSEERVEASASMAMADSEGWTRNTKYKSMPEHMLRFRSATFLIRNYAPGLLMGLHTADELADIAVATTPVESELNALFED